MTPNEPRPREAVRAEIREFLSSRRAKITPEQAGLPSYGVAAAGWWGYAARRSRSSPESPRSTTCGSSAETRSASRRASSTASRTRCGSTPRSAPTCSTCSARPGARGADRVAASTAVRLRPTLQRLIDSMHEVPAVVLSGRLDVLGMNDLGRALFAPLYGADEQPSNARIVFLDPEPPPSSASGTPSPTTPSPSCAQRPDGPPTTVGSPTSSGNCPRAARTSASAGPPTTSGSTTPASRGSGTTSSATWTCRSSPFPSSRARAPAW